MKRKLFLSPITLIALTPMISMVGCGSDTPIPSIHKVKIDPSSDTSDITISTPEITLSQELVIPYQIINPEKELDVDNSWLDFDSSQLPLSNPEFSHDNNKVIIPAEKVTTYDITICLKSKDVPERTEFTPSIGQMSSYTIANFEIDWTNGHSLTFANDWQFTTSASSVKSVIASGGDTHPQVISIVFNEEVKNNITDGTLTFTYNDLTTKKDNISATVDNICINKYIPDPEDVIITGGPTDLVDTMEILPTAIGLEAELPGFKIKNADANDLTIHVSSDAWIPTGDIIATPKITQQISDTEQEFSIILVMEDLAALQAGDIYQLHIAIMLSNKLIFVSNEYKVNVKESVTQESREIFRTVSLLYNADEYCYYAIFTGFHMKRINDLFALQPQLFGQEYRVTLYKLDGETEIDDFYVSFRGTSSLSDHSIMLWRYANIDQDIQFKIGITRAYTNGEDICTILDPSNSEIYTVKPCIPGK